MHTLHVRAQIEFLIAHDTPSTAGSEPPNNEPQGALSIIKYDPKLKTQNYLLS